MGTVPYGMESPDDVAFVEPCELCSGYGKIRHSAHTSSLCVECEGSGRALTVAGKRLIAFLRALGVSMPTPDGWRHP